MLFEELIDAPVFDDDMVEEEAVLDSAAEEEEIEGIAFTVPEGFSRRECFILRQALYKLSDSSNPVATDLNYVFRRNEHRIHQIARRLISSTGGNATVVIGPSALRNS